MRNRVTILSAMLVSAAACVFLAAQQQQSVRSADQEYRDEGALARVVRCVRANRQTELSLHAPISLPSGVNTISEIIRSYSLLRFSVVGAITTSDDDKIRTWYKLKTLETLTRQPGVPEDDLMLNFPKSLLPLGPSEIFYVVGAGRVVIDGIKIEQLPEEEGLVLQKGRQYVGAFYLVDRGRFGVLAAGADSLYEVDGDDLRPQSKSGEGLTKEFHDLFNNRLPKLHQVLAEWVGPQQQLTESQIQY